MSPDVSGAFYRRTSQKPDEELIDNFKKSFPDVIAASPFVAGRARNSGTVNPVIVDSVMQGGFVSLTGAHSHKSPCHVEC
jgi:hypothetical protein